MSIHSPPGIQTPAGCPATHIHGSIEVDTLVASSLQIRLALLIHRAACLLTATTLTYTSPPPPVAAGPRQWWVLPASGSDFVRVNLAL